jgi:nicotinamidase-related amidase
MARDAVVSDVKASETMAFMTQALLVMDVQNAIVARIGDADELLARLNHAIDGARRAGVPVIYVRVAFREGYPEVASANKTFSALAGRGGMGEADEATQIHPRVAPRPGEVVVVKKRVSAFAGSDLALVLRSQRIDTLVLTGIATSGVVLSTLREAADLDFGLVVLADACADSDPEVHRVLTEKVFVRQADVTTVGVWTESLPVT